MVNPVISGYGRSAAVPEREIPPGLKMVGLALPRCPGPRQVAYDNPCDHRPRGSLPIHGHGGGWVCDCYLSRVLCG